MGLTSGRKREGRTSERVDFAFERRRRVRTRQRRCDRLSGRGRACAERTERVYGRVKVIAKVGRVEKREEEATPSASVPG